MEFGIICFNLIVFRVEEEYKVFSVQFYKVYSAFNQQVNHLFTVHYTANYLFQKLIVVFDFCNARAISLFPKPSFIS